MAKQLMSIGGHLKNLIYEDSTEYPIVLTDENGDGSAFNGKTLVGNASGQFVPSTVTGYITGPGSSTDNTVVRFDGITGTVIQGSGVAIDDSDNVDIPGQLTMGSSNIVVTTVAGYLDPGSIDQDGASTNQVLAWSGAAWVPTSVAGVGGITGALGSTDNVLLRSDGTGGSAAQGSGIVVADTTNNVSGMGTLGCGAITSTGGLSAIAGSFQTNNLTTYSLNVQNIQEDTSGVAINFMAVKTGVAETSGNLRNAARIRAWFSGVNNDDGIISLRGFDGTNTEFGILTADSDNAGRVGILNDAPSYVLDVNGTFRAAGAAIFGADVTFNESILFDDAHGMYIEPSSTTWNFGSNSSSNLTAAFGNAGSGVMNMTIDGSLLLGVAGTSRGSCILYNGAGGNTAGYVILYSRNATPYYLWVEDDMTLKVSAAAPVNNADGTVVGAQT